MIAERRGLFFTFLDALYIHIACIMQPGIHIVWRAVLVITTITCAAAATMIA